MDQTSIIRDLLRWLDEHLDQPLSLDNVAAKAGYSKWHLQRMFKDVTGEAIGAYIRARRLSRAAIALRLTARPILDIALQYRFDSQQTFTRAFKKQFNKTPALYRRLDEWCSDGICSAILLDDVPMPEHEFVTLPLRTVTGIENSCSHRLEDWATACTHMRQEFWLHHISVAKTIPDYVYGLYSTTRNPDKEDEQTVHYTTAVAKEFAAFTTEENVHEVEMPGGEYLCFTFSGIPYRGAMQEFLFTIYGQCVPRLGITRRRGYDIESYKLRKGTDIRYPDAADVDETDPRHHIEEFKYYIPVRRDAQ